MTDELVRYTDFILRISPSTEAGRFVVQAASATAGEAAGTFVLPFSDTELENLILKVGLTRRGVRRIHSPEWNAALGFGEKLYTHLFQDDIRATFLSSRNEALREGKGLRIKIVLDAPALADYPWEFLYDPSLGRFLTLYEGTPLVRYIELPVPPPAMQVAPPLRILVLAASPVDLPPLDLARERDNLERALSELVQNGLVTVEWVEPASLEGLRSSLLKHQVHVFHFIGHGYFDQANRDGVLALEDEGGRSKLVSGERLAVVLGNHPSLRLAILNACEGGRTSVQDPFASAAATLLRSGGLAAVVAMQFEITDAASIAFTSGFYGALGKGRPVDAAVSQGRLSIFTAGNDVEWATPVLYLRAPDGIIFARPAPAPVAGMEQERAEKESLGIQPGEPERRAEVETGKEERKTQSAFAKGEQAPKTAVAEKLDQRKGPPSASLFMTALTWAIGVSMFHSILRLPMLVFLGPLFSQGQSNISSVIAILLLALPGAIAGGICGIILRRKMLPANSKQYVLAMAGWGTGWGIVEAISQLYMPGMSPFLLGMMGGLLGFLGGLVIRIAKPARPGRSVWSILGRMGVVALLLLGALGPWFQVSGCAYGGPPPTEIVNGYEILITKPDGLTTMVIPLYLLFLIAVLRIVWPRLRSNNTSIWLEWIGAVASVIGLGLYTLRPHQKILWGFWSTINGCALALLVLSVEWFRRESSESPSDSLSPPTERRQFWRRRFWRLVAVIVASSLLLALLIATAIALTKNS